LNLTNIFYHKVAFKNSARPPELFIFICTVYRRDKKDRYVTNELRYTIRYPHLIEHDTQIAYLLHAAEFFLRSEQDFSQSRNSPHITEHESSLLQ